MFSLQIIDTDAFLDMPLSTQALYFHLGMRADDDGFISNARRVQKLVGASDDDMRILLMKRFLLPFDSGVYVIKHWKISNYIQKDRYRPTLYKEEKGTLFMKPDGAYTDHPGDGFKPCLPPVPEATPPPVEPDVAEPVSSMDTECIRRIGKERLGEDRLGKVNNIFSGGDGDAHEDAEKIVLDYLENRGGYLPTYFCSSPEVLDAAELFTTALFKRWTTRSPTKEDVAHVFFVTRRHEQNPQTGEYETSFPQDNKDLLMYAFEQASNAGKPGDWNYIGGVLRNLHQRGIKTLDQADDYDFERDMRNGRW
jgi:hypothetical protein